MKQLNKFQLQDLGEEMPPVYNPFDKLDKKASTDFDAIHNQVEVNLDADEVEPPIAITMGTNKYGDNLPFGSYGDISCIVGESKSRKTFFKTALIASYLSGGTKYFENIKGVDRGSKWIIDVDTEQSKYHSQKAFRRVGHMMGGTPVNYLTVSLRELPNKERLNYIEWLLTESKYAQEGIGLVSIDGYADLVDDFNSIEEATNVISKLMKWSTDLNCHITGILHKNYGTNKPVGHIGSFILKKAETVAFVELSDDDKQITSVHCKYSRNIPFEDVSFELEYYKDFGTVVPQNVNFANKLKPF